jgi:hypothetical protein
MCEGGEGGIREVEKDYGGIIHGFILRDGEGNFWGVLGLESEIYSGIYSAPGG